MMDMAAIRELLELGWPAIVLVAAAILYRREARLTSQYIERLVQDRDYWREQWKACMNFVVAVSDEDEPP